MPITIRHPDNFNTPVQQPVTQSAIRVHPAFITALAIGLFWVLFHPHPSSAGQGRPWHEVRNWGYQLQGLRLDELRASPFDLLVIDYSRDGSESRRFTKEEISTIKRGGGKGRLVLSYLSIGEAENYRYYWKESWLRKRPSWLGGENPDWEGNYKVRYWDPRWRRIVFDFLDKILEAGFDGVYLDIIDAYEYFEERGRSSAAEEMKQLIREIAHYARVVRGDKDFGIFPQNGHELLDDPEYLSVITGVGREETYFGYEKDDRRTPAEVTAQIESFLQVAQRAGKLVLNVDYTTNPRLVAQSYDLASRQGYAQYCATRELDRLTQQPWFQAPAR